jgi:tRNA modification GTPase
LFSPSDTIVAIATPPGRGGLGVVRVSGPRALILVRSILVGSPDLQPRHATLSKVLGFDGHALDEVVVTFFQAPHSYTTQDVVELSMHGSPALLKEILERVIGAGARLAEPGEFTLRAFLGGRVDLVQAEAVADLVDAVTPLQARVAFDQLEGTLTKAIGRLDALLFDLAARLEASLDFPDEEYHFVAQDETRVALEQVRDGLQGLLNSAGRGRMIREGRQVAILGKPNVGKSTLFNWLVGSDRAIVAEMPGTTRDLVSESVDFEGIRLRLVDTAGIRHGADSVEQEGVNRAKQAARVADLLVLVFDLSQPVSVEDQDVLLGSCGKRRVMVFNKRDLVSEETVAATGFGGEGVAPLDEGPADVAVCVSLQTGQGLERLRTLLRVALDAEGGVPGDSAIVTNVRHETLLRQAAAALDRAIAGIDARGPGAGEDLVLEDIADARRAFEEVTGRRTTEDVLAHIFERFCIGK